MAAAQAGRPGLNRLTKAAGWGGHTYEYFYDANGNRTSVKVDGATTQTLAYNAGNQVTSTGYSYDQAGNRTTDPSAAPSPTTARDR